MLHEHNPTLGARLKSIFVNMPTEEVIYMHLRPTESINSVNELICKLTGIQYPKLCLFYQNKPISNTISIGSFPNDANIVAMLPTVGGITPCDMCYEPGNYSCSDCGKVYCNDCSTKVHKHPQRQHHTPKFFQESDTTPESNNILVDSDMSDSSQLFNSVYSFNDSPNTSLLLEHATMSMTLAEKFNLTRFRDYQKRAITVTRERTA